VDDVVLTPGFGSSGAGMDELGQSVAQIQSGLVRAYALLMLVGLAALVLLVALVRVGA
jgi:hypothetical protein